MRRSPRSGAAAARPDGPSGWRGSGRSIPRRRCSKPPSGPGGGSTPPTGSRRSRPTRGSATATRCGPGSPRPPPGRPASRRASTAHRRTCSRRSPRATRRYQERFGYIFIVCATGKTAEEMLELLRERLAERPRHRDPGRRRRAGEDHADPPGEDRPMSPITTHVLDIARGRPARGIAVDPGDRRETRASWTELARGVTDGDGRIGQFDPPARPAGARGLPAPLRHRRLFRGDRGPRLLSRGPRGRPDRRTGPALSHPPAAEPLRLQHLSRQLIANRLGRRR